MEQTVADREMPYRGRRRTVVRLLVPVAIVAVAATGIGLVPALASDSAPNLPSVTAQELVAKALGSDVTTFSGTVKVKADLGVPSQLLSAMGGRTAAGGADPQARALELMGGEHTLQVAADGPTKQRIGLVDTLSGYELVHNGDQVWAWDSAGNQALHLTAAGDRPAPGRGEAPLTGLPTPQDAARQFLDRSSATTSVAVAGTATVAGHKAYLLSVKPTEPGSTIGEVRISIDAERGMPLAVLVRGADGGQVLDAHYSSLSYTAPNAKTFEFTAPKGAKVTERQADEQSGPNGSGPNGSGPNGSGPNGSGSNGSAPNGSGSNGTDPAGRSGAGVIGQGWTAVLATRLPDLPSSPVHENTNGGNPGGAVPKSPEALIKSVGKPVAGGTLISTKVLNVLITDDGRLFAGAVTLPVLQSAAGVI